MNETTRREQVLNRLSEAGGGWVDGPDLANAQIGGSEGLKRVRELRMDGYDIEMRKHPDPGRAIWQYRMASPHRATPLPTVLPGRSTYSRAESGGGRGLPVQPPDGQQQLGVPAPVSRKKYEVMPTRIAFGEAIPCPSCDGRKVRIDPVSKRRGPCVRCNGFGLVPV